MKKNTKKNNTKFINFLTALPKNQESRDIQEQHGSNTEPVTPETASPTVITKLELFMVRSYLVTLIRNSSIYLIETLRGLHNLRFLDLLNL